MEQQRKINTHTNNSTPFDSIRLDSIPFHTRAHTHAHTQLDGKHASDMEFKQLRCTIFQEIAYIEIHNSQIEQTEQRAHQRSTKTKHQSKNNNKLGYRTMNACS